MGRREHQGGGKSRVALLCFKKWNATLGAIGANYWGRLKELTSLFSCVQYPLAFGTLY